MIPRSTLLALPLALALSITPAPRAWAVAPEIKDDAKIFSPEAVKKANDLIREIARKHGRDLMVETFVTVPGNQADKVRELPAGEKTKFFRNWSKDRIDYHAVNGVYVLICKEPTFLWVEVSEKSVGTFGGQFGGELGKMLQKDFREKQFDEGLLRAVKQVQEKLSGTKPKK